MAQAKKTSDYPAQRKLIDTDIKTDTFRPCYLICGDEAYLRRQIRQNLKAALMASCNEANYYEAKGAGADAQDMVNFAQTMPFLAERRVLFAEDTGFFKSGSEILAQYVSDPSDTAVMVFTETAVDASTKLYKAFSARGRIVKCDPQTSDMLQKWVKVRLAKAGKRAPDAVIREFTEAMGTDMSHIETELTKLTDYAGDRADITAKDIRTVCSGQTSARVFDLTNALADRNREAAMRHYFTLLEMEEKPNTILFFIERQFRIMLQVAEMRRRNAGDDMIARETGISPRIVFKYVNWTRRFTEHELRAYLDMCLENERAMKSSRLDKQIGVEMVISEITKEQGRK